MRIQVNVNGEPREADVEPRLLLVHFVREHLGLTGTHWGWTPPTAGPARCTSTASRSSPAPSWPSERTGAR